MGFQDLPADWPDRPLTDPQLLADVLDLTLSHRDRVEGSIGVLVCDADQRLLVPAVIGELDEIAPDAERSKGLRNFVSAVVDGLGAGSGAGPLGLHFSIARRYGLSITSDDLRWRDAAVAACGSRVTLLGVHVVTVEGSRLVPGRWPLPSGGSLADAS
jgi:hypothetical protein